MEIGTTNQGIFLHHGGSGFLFFVGRIEIARQIAASVRGKTLPSRRKAIQLTQGRQRRRFHLLCHRTQASPRNGFGVTRGARRATRIVITSVISEWSRWNGAIFIGTGCQRAAIILVVVVSVDRCDGEGGKGKAAWMAETALDER
eukprot:scaffold280023_cov35-Attheya_sp.AAC.1